MTMIVCPMCGARILAVDPIATDRTVHPPVIIHAWCRIDSDSVEDA